MAESRYVRVKTKNGLVFEGQRLPQETLVIKLKDGYNVGIHERNVERVEELTPPTTEPSLSKSVRHNPSLPRIHILHTGGTIASKVDYATGGVTNLLQPEELLAQYPELQNIANVQATFVANMSSDDMRLAHYNILTRAVQQAIRDGAKGVIITQGTDTLHYTAAALHYALQGTPIPVVLVGSQRSSDRGSTDAATNLFGATRFIKELGFPGVYLAMHGSSNDDDIAILRGVNARKMHSSRRDAFKSINVPVVAVVSQETVTVVHEPPKTEQKFTPTSFKEDLRVGMCYVHPQFHASVLDAYKDFDGLVLLGTGLGHAPITRHDEHTEEHEVVFSKVSSLVKSMPVVMATQCVYGRVNLQVYSPGRKLQDAGVLGHDLAYTPETLFIKLCWLLSQQKPPTSLTDDFGDVINRTEEGTYE